MSYGHHLNSNNQIKDSWFRSWIGNFPMDGNNPLPYHAPLAWMIEKSTGTRTVEMLGTQPRREICRNPTEVYTC